MRCRHGGSIDLRKCLRDFPMLRLAVVTSYIFLHLLQLLVPDQQSPYHKSPVTWFQSIER